jgi:hypothetical protein
MTWNDLPGDLAGYVQPKYERVKITFVPKRIRD